MSDKELFYRYVLPLLFIIAATVTTALIILGGYLDFLIQENYN